MITFDTLPEPTETRERSGKYPPYGQTHRDIDTRYVLGVNADGDTVRVTVSTSHRPESKAFRTTCTWGLVRAAEPGSPFLVETWASDHKVTMVHQTYDVARYSLARMQDHHQRALASLRSSWDFHRQVFEEAAREGRLTDETPVLATSQP